MSDKTENSEIVPCKTCHGMAADVSACTSSCSHTFCKSCLTTSSCTDHYGVLSTYSSKQDCTLCTAANNIVDNTVLSNIQSDSNCKPLTFETSNQALQPDDHEIIDHPCKSNKSGPQRSKKKTEDIGIITQRDVLSKSLEKMNSLHMQILQLHYDYFDSLGDLQTRIQDSVSEKFTELREVSNSRLDKAIEPLKRNRNIALQLSEQLAAIFNPKETGDASFNSDMMNAESVQRFLNEAEVETKHAIKTFTDVLKDNLKHAEEAKESIVSTSIMKPHHSDLLTAKELGELQSENSTKHDSLPIAIGPLSQLPIIQIPFKKPNYAVKIPTYESCTNVCKQETDLNPPKIVSCKPCVAVSNDHSISKYERGDGESQDSQLIGNDECDKLYTKIGNHTTTSDTEIPSAGRPDSDQATEHESSIIDNFEKNGIDENITYVAKLSTVPEETSGSENETASSVCERVKDVDLLSTSDSADGSRSMQSSKSFEKCTQKCSEFDITSSYTNKSSTSTLCTSDQASIHNLDKSKHGLKLASGKVSQNESMVISKSVAKPKLKNKSECKPERKNKRISTREPPIKNAI